MEELNNAPEGVSLELCYETYLNDDIMINRVKAFSEGEMYLMFNDQEYTMNHLMNMTDKKYSSEYKLNYKNHYRVLREIRNDPNKIRNLKKVYEENCLKPLPLSYLRDDKNNKNFIKPQMVNPFSSFTDVFGFKAFTEQIPDMIDVVEDKLPDTEERKNFIQLMEKLVSKIPNLGGINSGNDTLEQVNGYFSTLREGLTPGVLLVVTYGLYAKFKNWTTYTLYVASCFNFGMSCGEKLNDLLFATMEASIVIPLYPDVDMDEIVPQMSESEAEGIAEVVATFALAILAGKSGKSASMCVSNFVKDFSRSKQGIVDLSKVMLRFIQYIANTIRTDLLNLSPVSLLNTFSTEIDDFMQKCRIVCFRFNRNTLAFTEFNYIEILTLLEVGRTILRSTRRGRDTEGVLRLVQENCNSLNKITVEMERNDVSLTGLRQEPVAILLAGGPGVAKSIGMLYGSFLTCSSVVTDEERDEFERNPGLYIYSRKQELVFMDSLTNKARVFTYDDILQSRDVAGSPACEAMELIRVINTDEYRAHMAHLEAKGNVYVHPKFVWATTNQQELKSQAIHSNKALRRRFHLSYIVTPKPEFTVDVDIGKDVWNNRIDKNKLPKARINQFEKKTEKQIRADELWKTRIDKLKLPLTTVNDPKDLEIDGELVSDLRPDQLLYHQTDENDNIIRVVEFEQVISDAIALELEHRKRFALHKSRFKEQVLKYSEPYKMILRHEEPESEEVPADFSELPDDVITPQSGSAYSTDSDEAEGEDLPFLGYYDLHNNEVWELEYFMNINPKTKQKFKALFKDNYRTHSCLHLVLDLYGYHEVSYQIESGRLKFLNLDKHLSNRKKILPIRTFHSVKIFVEAYLCKVPTWASVKKFWNLNAESICKVIAFFAGCGLISYLAKWLYTWWTGKPAPESFGLSDKMRTAKVNPKFIKNASAVKNFIATPQYGADFNGIDMIRSIVSSNCFNLDIQNTDGTWRHQGTITFVRGRIALLPYHFVYNFLEGLEDNPERLERVLRISHGPEKAKIDFLLTLKELLMGVKDSDLYSQDGVLAQFPDRFPPRKDIVDRFALRSDFNRFKKNIKIMLPIIQDGREFVYGRGSAMDRPITVTDSPEASWEVRENYSYDIPTSKGDCGTLLCILGGNEKRKFFGMHVAGMEERGLGFACSISQEDLEEALQAFDPQVESLYDDNIIVPQGGIDISPRRFDVIGKVRKAPRRPHISKIIPSSMAGSSWEINVAPAKMGRYYSNGLWIDPYINSQIKYCTPDILINQDIIRECCEHYFATIEHNSKIWVDRRLLTMDEAIYGIEDEPDFGSIAAGTSVGYPMNTPGARNLKKELLKETSPQSVKDAAYIEVKRLVLTVIGNAEKGIRMFHVFTDFSKDELRPINKDSRLVSGAPFIYLIVIRMYFGSFCLWFMKNRISNYSAVGVNCFSTEWDTIARLLLSKGAIKSIGAGDHSGFDCRQKPFVQLVILIAMNLWYNDGPVNARVRNILFMELWNSRHINDGLIVEWFSSLPSGHPLTIIINTIYNAICFIFAWRRIVGSLITMNKNTHFIFQGDDVAYSVTPAYSHLYNDYTIGEVLKELGMVYTNEQKGETTSQLRDITEIEFLKRSFFFSKVDGIWVAPLKIESILRMVDWVKMDDPDNIASNISEAILELSLHPKKFFLEWAPKLIKSFEAHYPHLEPTIELHQSYERHREMRLGTVDVFF